MAAVAALAVGAAVWFFALEPPGHDESEYTGSVVPEFDSWPEMEEFIEGRHARLREFAEERPDETLDVVLTLSSALTVDQLQFVAARHETEPYYVEYSAGMFHGVSSLSPSVTLRSLEERAHAEGAPVFQITYVAVSGSAKNLALMSIDPLTALLDATPALDLREGLRPPDSTVNPPRSVFRDYQRLAPEGAGDVGYGTPWPILAPP
jgi:hypothetical protein